MRVLWICGARIVGGAERVTLQLATLLSERGHVVEALCRPDGDLYPALTNAGCKTHPGWLGGSANLRAVAAIRRTLDETAPDIALVTTADEWVWSCLVRRPTRSRLVLVRHMALPLNWRVRALASYRADAIVAVSDAVRHSLIGRLGVRPDRIHVIRNPVRFSPRPAVPGAGDRARAREALTLPENGRLVGFFGGLSRSKGLHDVLRAVQHANAQVGCTRVLVCGRAADRGDGWSIAALTSEFGIDRLHFLGETERMEEALTAADIVVVATHRRLSEALPATLVEAMACGTPVLGYATGGIIEAVGEDGGCLAEADDVDDLSRKLSELLADPAGAQQMAAVALARARRLFDPQLAADRYEQLFVKLCSG